MGYPNRRISLNIKICGKKIPEEHARTGCIGTCIPKILWETVADLSEAFFVKEFYYFFNVCIPVYKKTSSDGM